MMATPYSADSAVLRKGLLRRLLPCWKECAYVCLTMAMVLNATEWKIPNASCQDLCSASGRHYASPASWTELVCQEACQSSGGTAASNSIRGWTFAAIAQKALVGPPHVTLSLRTCRALPEVQACLLICSSTFLLHLHTRPWVQALRSCRSNHRCSGHDMAPKQANRRTMNSNACCCCRASCCAPGC